MTAQSRFSQKLTENKACESFGFTGIVEVMGRVIQLSYNTAETEQLYDI